MAVPQGDAGVVVLTALGLEYQAVRTYLTDLRRSTHAQGTGFEAGFLPDVPWQVVVARTGAGNASAAVLAERAIATFAPRAVVFVGVAGAIRDEVEVGDVVIASRVYAAHGGKQQAEAFLARPRAFEAPHDLLDLAEYLALSRSWSTAGPDGEASEFRVHVKPIAAGEVVLNTRDAPLAQQLRIFYNDAVAVEMEGAGVAQAAHLNRVVPLLVVRGISDKADGQKYAASDERWQPVAAHRAALVAFSVIREWASGLATEEQAAQEGPRVKRLPVPAQPDERSSVAAPPAQEDSRSESDVGPDGGHGKYVVDAREATGVQIGERNTQNIDSRRSSPQA